MSDRKRAIETLKQLRLDYEEFYEEHNNEVTQAYDMAISSLETDEAYQLEYESTTKNDLEVDAISRSDVLKLMQDNWHTHNGDWAMQESMDDIRALPSVTPQEPRWIPITERLPEKEEYVLCWLRYGDYMIAKWKYKEWTSEDEVIWVDGNLGTGTFDVVAWMPLPKAYREVVEE